MRMTASWYRPLGRPNTSSWRAMRARWRAPLGIVALVDLNERGHGARVVPSEQVVRCARSRQGQVAARWPSATLDSRSAQRPSKIKSGRGDVAGRSNKEMPLTKPLTAIAPYKSTGGERAYERRLGKDRSARHSRHSIASTKQPSPPVCDIPAQASSMQILTAFKRARGWQEAERRIRAAISSQHHQVRVRVGGLKPRLQRIGSRVPITRTRRVRSTSRRRAAHVPPMQEPAPFMPEPPPFGNRDAGPPGTGSRRR